MASLTSVQRFQSTPPARGATPRPCCSPWAATHFNPRPPRGGRPITVCSCPTRRLFQSTPPARGATVINHRIADLENISIHAPREGGDRLSGLGAARGGDFNPRPPRGGRRLPDAEQDARSDFNPRPPRGGRQSKGWSRKPPPLFQSTPPARGATYAAYSEIDFYSIFQSTPPARGATQYLRRCQRGRAISIHAPREGGDSKDAQFYLRIFDK